MTDFAALFDLDFFRHALLAAALASVLCGLVGTFVVLKRLVSLGGGIAHAAFGGLGIAFWAGVEPRLGAMAVAALSAVGLGFLDGERARRQDAAIGVLWAVGMAIGLVFVHWTPGYAPDLLGYLFGDILMVGPLDLALAAVADVVVIALLLLHRRRLVAVAFDEEAARIAGLRVRLYSIGLLALIALSIVVLLQLVGIVLVIALLTVPPLIARRLVRSLGATLVVSCALCWVVTTGGLLLAYRFDLPAGPAMVLLGGALLGLAQLVPARSARPAR
ncbi:MAG: metal ABC transporter permease [Acidobacteria bacterium]|nr:metal ABC transporter permease [Acidobacteriota bacterium]